VLEYSYAADFPIILIDQERQYSNELRLSNSEAATNNWLLGLYQSQNRAEFGFYQRTGCAIKFAAFSRIHILYCLPSTALLIPVVAPISNMRTAWVSDTLFISK
jgi:hypothetical protein